MDFFVLDNSICETTVGQLRGHTPENKIKIYQETKKCGFEYVIVASFNHMTRVGDTFCQWLVDKNEDRSKMFSFSEVTEGVKNGKLDTRGGVEDTRLEAKAKSTKKKRGQGQPFGGHTLSRPRTEMLEA